MPDASEDKAAAEGIDGDSGEPAVCVDEWHATETLSSDSSVEAADPDAILAVRLISSIGFGKGCGCVCGVAMLAPLADAVKPARAA